MPEAIRLIIWDLDDTFWHGTLTEGGIDYSDAHHDIVLELSRRGIISSICSKNNAGEIRRIFERRGLWYYFVFPSIDWSPKGQRVREIVEAAQLRAETVLFIDDNPGNRAEAASQVPGLQTADATILPTLLDDARLVGKDDPGLMRLKQYKLLERKRGDAVAAGGSNAAFLRASGIRVEIDHDVANHLGRAVELINRTNQLNFTKLRLPEEPAAAERELRALLDRFDIQAGLVRVIDAYGDYGYCGFYVVGAYNTGPRLHHFCFSCRTLGMGVEAFVYGLLGRPALDVVGEVLSTPHTDVVDWIAMEPAGDAAGGPAGSKLLPGVYLRGGCDLMNIAHYAGLSAREVVGEFNLMRGDINLRIDHSVVARHCIDGLPEDFRAACRAIGYNDDDLGSAILERPRGGTWIFSFADHWLPLFRHNATGLLMPFFAEAAGVVDPLLIQAADRATVLKSPAKIAAVEALAREFTFFGPVPESLFKDNLSALFGRIPRDAQAFVIMPKEFFGAERTPSERFAAVNRWTEEVAAAYAQVTPLPFMRFVERDDDLLPDGHGTRMVYYRMYQAIRRMSLDRMVSRRAA